MDEFDKALKAATPSAMTLRQAVENFDKAILNVTTRNGTTTITIKEGALMELWAAKDRDGTPSHGGFTIAERGDVDVLACKPFDAWDGNDKRFLLNLVIRLTNAFDPANVAPRHQFEAGDICPECNREVGGPRHKCIPEAAPSSTVPTQTQVLGEAVLASIAHGPITVRMVDGTPRIECASSAIAARDSIESVSLSFDYNAEDRTYTPTATVRFPVNRFELRDAFAASIRPTESGAKK